MAYNGSVGAYILCAPIAFPSLRKVLPSSLPPVALAPRRQLVSGQLDMPQIGHDLEAAELTVMGSGKKAWLL